MPIEIIGKSILGEKGFCLKPSKMGMYFNTYYKRIVNALPEEIDKIAITSLTGSYEVQATGGKYFPKIRELSFSDDCTVSTLFNAQAIYKWCKEGKDQYKSACDFIVWDWENFKNGAVLTFSREAPIISFVSTSTQKVALGTILRPSLMEYGDYLFSTMKEYMKEDVHVTLIRGNHYEYPEGSIPDIIKELANKYDICPLIGTSSEEDPNCYHRGESGNHVVAMW